MTGLAGDTIRNFDISPSQHSSIRKEASSGQYKLKQQQDQHQNQISGRPQLLIPTMEQETLTTLRQMTFILKFEAFPIWLLSLNPRMVTHISNMGAKSYKDFQV
jgi:hypothetical protein